jgi:hypothetical protein
VQPRRQAAEFSRFAPPVDEEVIDADVDAATGEEQPK